MPLIGYAIGDLDEHIIISDIYKPNDFHAGWYFIPYNFPNYTFVSVDYDNSIDEVVQDGDKFKIQGFDPYLERINFPDGKTPKKTEYIKDAYFHFPSGVPFNADYKMGYYWDIFGDINSPYLFIPYFNPNTYGEIVWLDLNTPLDILNVKLPFIEFLLNGLVFPFVEKIVADNSFNLPLQEKIISLLSCDIEMESPNLLRLKWSGEKVPFIEILRKDISESKYGNPIAVVPFSSGSFLIPIDNNSYMYSVRGSNGTGMSNVEITIGIQGRTYIQTQVNLGDFVKIYECDIDFVDKFETEILI